MAQRKPDPIDEIVQLIAPLSSVEHDHVVHSLTQQWGKPDQRQPWDKDKPITKGRRGHIAQIERRVKALAETLAAQEQDELLEELKLVWLRRALEEGEESLRKHGGIPAEEVFSRLRAKY